MKKNKYGLHLGSHPIRHPLEGSYLPSHALWIFE